MNLIKGVKMLKSMMYAAILLGIIAGFIGLGLWIRAGSNIAIGIAVGLIWISASVIFYYIEWIK